MEIEDKSQFIVLTPMARDELNGLNERNTLVFGKVSQSSENYEASHQ
jgi:hypothetical protein